MAEELIVHSSLVLEICTYLRSRKTDVLPADTFVGRTVPNPRAERMIIVRNSGGFDVNTAISNTSIDISVWGIDDPDADSLAGLAVGVLKQMSDGAPVIDVRPVTLPSDALDESGQPFRFARFRVIHRPISI